MAVIEVTCTGEVGVSVVKVVRTVGLVAAVSVVPIVGGSDVRSVVVAQTVGQVEQLVLLDESDSTIMQSSSFLQRRNVGTLLPCAQLSLSRYLAKRQQR